MQYKERFYFLPELAELLGRVLFSGAFVLLVVVSDSNRTLAFIFLSTLAFSIIKTASDYTVLKKHGMVVLTE